MKRSRPFQPALCAVVLSILSAASVPAHSAKAIEDKFTPLLAGALAEQKQAHFLIRLEDRVHLNDARGIHDRVLKRQLLYDRLRAQALQAQARATAFLQSQGVSFRQYYLLNAIGVVGDLDLARKLASLPEVTSLSLIADIHNELPTPDFERSASQSPTGTTWGVNRVHAPEVWSAYFIRGEGIVVGTADTGVHWEHPALKPHYRGWNGVNADHTYSWHDAVHDAPANNRCGSDAAVPCDDFGHGTHVTGTMVGDDYAGNQIGVAPGAHWIGCRNMAGGYGTIARYVECFEFMLAPYPPGGNPLTDGRPDLAADIVNNSWVCPPSEGCDSTHLDDMRSVVQRLNAAGILVVASAGNYGSACETVREPIAIYAETFTVGAVDSGDNIASFSSRGPVSVDGSNRMKPDLSAPGVSVRSSYPTNAYVQLSGTSMAAPHTAGVAALLWSAAPSLSGRITETVGILESTTTPRTTTQGCGGDSNTAVPNNVYGYGIVDALAAIQMAGNQYPLKTLRYYFPVYLYSTAP